MSGLGTVLLSSFAEQFTKYWYFVTRVPITSGAVILLEKIANMNLTEKNIDFFVGLITENAVDSHGDDFKEAHFRFSNIRSGNSGLLMCRFLSIMNAWGELQLGSFSIEFHFSLHMVRFI
jgi:hypothetical protein